MNIAHLRYAVEIAKTGSITQAADNLYMGQPNMSKAVKELESTLGIVIFKRTPRGVVPTQKGKEFLAYARNILAQIDNLESHYKQQEEDNQNFSAFVPRGSYIATAFTRFVNELDFDRGLELNFKETNTMAIINGVLEYECNLGIIRYQAFYEDYFQNMVRERGLKSQPVLEYEYKALMSKEHPLAGKEQVNDQQICGYTEIMHGDLAVPFLPVTNPAQSGCEKMTKRRIYVYERGSQFDLLVNVPGTYMWVSPMPQEVLDRYGLVQKSCKISEHRYRDVLIYHRDYHFTDLDKLFLEKLETVKKELGTCPN